MKTETLFIKTIAFTIQKDFSVAAEKSGFPGVDLCNFAFFRDEWIYIGRVIRYLGAAESVAHQKNQKWSEKKMAKKITNDVLAERLKNYHQSNDKFQKNFENNIVPEIKANTQLRHQFKGVVGTVMFIGVSLGGFLIWIFDKIKFWGDK